MAINSNNAPYESWKASKQNADYRDKLTQNTAYVREALAQDRYLKSSNRVNSGPSRNTRAAMANNSQQNPHVYGSEDMWGWQNWANTRAKKASTLAPGLYEVSSNTDAPGTQYPGPSRVNGWAGCSTCRRRKI
jgi:hypothetical protein|tara:strand:+ start:1875 stop:2273 length:399 start_codon:yes stop_codon:yes gene_type:complete